jgi:uncharacterized protein
MFSIQRILGQEDKFVGLLEESAKEASASVHALRRFLEASAATRSLEDFVASRRKEKRINDEIREAISTSFVTALEREDIEAIAVALYRIPKTIEKVAERIMIAPHHLQQVDLSRHLTILDEATNTVIEMIRGLNSKMSFEAIKAHNLKLQNLEGEADNLILEQYQQLYSGEIEPIRALFLKDIFELLEKVADRCRDAGNVINLVVLKNS